MSLYAWFSSHPAAVALLALISSAAVNQMPQPITGGSRFYLWVYGFCHALLLHADKFRVSVDSAPAVAPTPQSAPPAKP